MDTIHQKRVDILNYSNQMNEGMRERNEDEKKEKIVMSAGEVR